MSEKTFSTVITCMDGRVQLPVNEWMQNQYNTPYVDTITAAGPEKVILAGAASEVDSMKEKVTISCDAHGSEVVAVAGHHDCAGNPVGREQKVEEIKQAVEAVQSWGFPVQVVGLYVNEKWEVETI
ncbi:carbonic anhydrase [Pontibacillus salipaludis]|uniref:Uncharacterized protein n=1 Tax=Pontibacillus salipaludis TaxID=1697394 RepID=A0ABQ1Q670_9BACI|nr:carbonic anhydrase [Pontibacillus salipaludis]GGD15389.1 hypothetical protein GCM10011389_23880 [Pontibacillus salipaludis]